MTEKVLVEIREGDSVYAFVGPFDDRAKAKAWIEKAKPTLDEIPMRASAYSLFDADETLQHLKSEGL